MEIKHPNLKTTRLHLMDHIKNKGSKEKQIKSMEGKLEEIQIENYQKTKITETD